MMFEYLRMTLGKKHLFAQFLSILTGVLLFAFLFFYKYHCLNERFIAIIPILLAAIFISLLFDKDSDSYRSYPYLLSGILYISLPFTLSILLTSGVDGNFNGLLLLSLMIILWSNDVGAYIFGMSFGQKNGHKLFPSISPKKSWEGFFGGLLTSLLAGWLLSHYLLLPFGLLHSLVISLLICLFGTLGDLSESQLKRNFGVKDAGKIMPGHGGLLDRFDGALLSFPVVISYIYLTGLF